MTYNTDAPDALNVNSAVVGINPEHVYTPSELAERFRVDPKTITRWAGRGRLGVEGQDWYRTLGGHHRFPGTGVLRAMKNYVRGWPAGEEVPAEETANDGL